VRRLPPRLLQCGDGGHLVTLLALAGPFRGPHHQASHTMIETNPILAQIADLKGRVESLRGYL
jgi:hypothetical protein